MAKKNVETTGKLSELDFTTRAIANLRTDRSKGIHVVYSNFNAAFKQYYGKEARETVDKLCEAGKLAKRVVRGGVMIYLPGEAPIITDRSADTIKAITG
ncbi:MAG: hypothetical protein IMZ61_10915 [Planctomycetes bacterium]|nr:hypothetical protein [Planctomycetota bacterium]